MVTGIVNGLRVVSNAHKTRAGILPSGKVGQVGIEVMDKFDIAKSTCSGGWQVLGAV